MKLAEIRQQYPQYAGVSDMDLARSLHAKHYSSIPFGTFARQIGMFDEAPVNPTDGMSAFERGRAGWGKAAVDLARGTGQMVGLVSREDVKNARERDAALMATTAGKVGNLAGAIANTIPAAFIPGANTVGGATAIGAGLGFLQPSASTGETASNVGLGGALGGGSVLAARGLSALYQGGKALGEPFMRGGQERIAGRVLETFAGGAKPARQAAQNIDDAMLGHGLGVKPILPGVQPTTAELAENAGLSQLERTLRNNPEYITTFAERGMANKDAMMAALNDIAGNPYLMDKATAARAAATKPLYESAARQMVEPDKELVSLIARPSMRKAWEVAADLAAEAGEKIDPGTIIDQKTGEFIRKGAIEGKALHYLKMAMDDISDNPAVHGIAGNQARAVANTRNQLLSWINNNIADYGQASNTYAYLSRPINEMEVGQAFRDKLQPALADFGASSRSRAATFAEALRNGDDLTARTLGRDTAKLRKVLKPEQVGSLRQVAEQLARRANADELGRAVGSNTSQNMVGQNVLRQILGPLGLPESSIQKAAENALVQSAMRPVQFVGQIGEQRVMQNLARASLDPNLAAKLIKAGVDPRTVGLLLRNQHFLAPALVSGTDAARK